jgi:tetratricopeptide (TPR) repeat protein
MILTILKQTTRFHLDEKDFEVANVYADLYSQMIIHYINKRGQAVAALKDLAYEFYIIGLYRNAEKYYRLVKEHYGVTALNDQDLVRFGEILEKLDHLGEAMNFYQRVVRYYPHSPCIRDACRQISRIFDLCGNRNKASFFRGLSNPGKQSHPPVERKNIARVRKQKKSA